MDRSELLDDLIAESLLQQSHARRFLYADVEELILTGYLSHSWELEGCLVVFKSLAQKDLRKWGRGMHDQRWKSWMLAASVLSIDGYDVPEDGVAVVFQEWVDPLPMRAVEELYKIIVAPFIKRIERAHRLVKAYCCEDYSRQAWLLLGRPYSYEVNFQANSVFQYWSVHNHQEDKRLAGDLQWAHTRMIMAATSSEGAKKLWERQDKDRERRENEERREIERAVNWVIQGDMPAEKVYIDFHGQKLEVQKMRFAATVDDLKDEMRRVFDGDKDYHDVLVDEHYAKIRQGVERKRKEARQRAQKARSALPHTAKNLVGYTPKQLKELRPDLSARKGVVVEDSRSAEFDHMYSRYIQNDIQPGVLGPDMKVIPNDRGKSKETSPSLMGKLQGRSPNPLKEG